jgi:2-polyprenyl-3-methyl-5-hydroxy-6-metoxy-1,4-benzoquinol methylase
MEYIDKCLICNNRDRDILYRNVKGYDIVKCLQCGLVYSNFQPSSGELQKYYSEEHGLVKKAMTTNVEDDVKRYRDIKIFLKLINRYNSTSKNICEIGCSYGYLLWGLRREGYTVKGCELSKRTARIGREKLGLDISEGDFPEDTNEVFDVFILRHVLEHLKNPDKIIERIYERMDSGGVLIIVAPNIESLTAILFGRHWNWLDPPLHLFYFSKKTIAHLLGKYELRIVHIFTKKGDSFNFYYHFLRWIAQSFDFEGKIHKDREVNVDSQSSEVVKLIKKYLILSSNILHLLTYPIWWFLWKFGYGEELWVIARKHKLVFSKNTIAGKNR